MRATDRDRRGMDHLSLVVDRDIGGPAAQVNHDHPELSLLRPEHRLARGHGLKHQAIHR